MTSLDKQLKEFSVNIKRVMEAAPFEGINEKIIILETLNDVLLDLEAHLEDDQYTPVACDFTLKLVTLSHVIDIYTKMPNSTEKLYRRMLDMLNIYNNTKSIIPKHLH